MKKLLFIALILVSIVVNAQHTIVLNSGEKIEGVVLSLNNDVWNVFVDGEEKTVSMKEVASIFFKEYVPYDGVFIPESEEKKISVDGFEVRYQIKNREMIKNPKISIGTEDHGTVVVKVIIDRYGHVRSVEPGAPGSTTSSKYLYTKAQTAVKTAKFNEYLKGPINTEGTVTIVY
jgi:hypothetical protein